MSTEKLPPEGWELAVGWRVVDVITRCSNGGVHHATRDEGGYCAPAYVNDDEKEGSCPPCADDMGAIVRKAEAPTGGFSDATAKFLGGLQAEIGSASAAAQGLFCVCGAPRALGVMLCGACKALQATHPEDCACGLCYLPDCTATFHQPYCRQSDEQKALKTRADLLRSMTPEELAVFVPLSDAQIVEAIAKGQRAREIAEGRTPAAAQPFGNAGGLQAGEAVVVVNTEGSACPSCGDSHYHFHHPRQGEAIALPLADWRDARIAELEAELAELKECCRSVLRAVPVAPKPLVFVLRHLFAATESAPVEPSQMDMEHLFLHIKHGDPAP